MSATATSFTILWFRNVARASGTEAWSLSAISVGFPSSVYTEIMLLSVDRIIMVGVHLQLRNPGIPYSVLMIYVGERWYIVWLGVKLW